ncbi:MAG: copper amine oxidase N-terminal domain-containing protein [Syntrophomonadaceae bacterium]|nr:copper amine oxidase N-terminal domain-containing protein [Syntrophomonadaceae bacterium]
MKNIIMVFLITFIWIGMTETTVMANDNIELYINNEQKYTDPKPFIDEQTGRTYVPIRCIAENFGAEVDWLESEGEITIFKPNETIIVLFINHQEAIVNEVPVYLDAAPYIINDRTMVPLRFVAESLNLAVAWDADGKWINISGEINNPQNNSTVIELKLPDDTIVNIHLLEGWEYQQGLQYQQGFFSLHELFLLRHESGTSISFLVENLPEKVSRDDYIEETRAAIVKEFNVSDQDIGSAEIPENTYSLWYMVEGKNYDYIVYQTLIFPYMDSKYMIEKYAGVLTTILPIDFADELISQIADDKYEIIEFTNPRWSFYLQDLTIKNGELDFNNHLQTE